MFTTKKEKLFDTPVSKGDNSFVKAALKKSAETRSGNGALKYDSSGDIFVDQFSSLGIYRKPRTFDDISKDASIMWSTNSRIAVCFILFLRLISRVTSLWDGSRTATVQKGAGLKHEAIMRMIWLHVNHPAVFWNNIQLFIACGSWKDIFEMLRYDLTYNGWEGKVLNWQQFGQLIAAGLENPNTTELVKKYLPQIKAKSKAETLQQQANTMIGKFICSVLGINYEKYRKIKSSGKAHTWQQLISKRLFQQINFDTIHGRALLLLVSGKFLANNKLEDKYDKWIAGKPIAKFTGYVHELAMKISNGMKPYLRDTINKQYEGLLELAKNNVNLKSGLIVVRDTSTSMDSSIIGCKNISSSLVSRAIAIFFSDMLSGMFKNAYIEFSRTALMKTFIGNTLVEKWNNDRGHIAGNTNFLSVADLFVEIKMRGIAEEQFPTGVLCISDWEFDPAQLGKTNVETFRQRLREAGFSKNYIDNFQIILWNIPNTFYSREAKPKFETFGHSKNVFYLSGYDASILGFLLGREEGQKTPKTARELFDAAMDQEILKAVHI